MITDNETWILYQTTNVCNSKIYVGVHKIKNTSKSRTYLGSGDGLRAAIEKYGRKNFTRVTLAEFSCAEDAYTAEEKMVTEEFIKQPDTYNMKIGGMGCKGLTITEAHKAKISAANKANKYSVGRVLSAETKARMSASAKGNKRCVGRVLSEETKAKISDATKGEAFSQEKRKKIGDVSRGNKYCVGRILSAETKAKISSNSPKSKPVMIQGKYYISICQAAKSEKISETAMRSRLTNIMPKWEEYRFATQEEVTNFLGRGALVE
jgi:group I intron endonuclease